THGYPHLPTVLKDLFHFSGFSPPRRTLLKKQARAGHNVCGMGRTLADLPYWVKLNYVPGFLVGSSLLTYRQDQEDNMAKDLQVQLGRRVRQLRTQAGITQAVLAERIGVSPEFLSRMERGSKSPSLQTIGNLAAALGVAPRDLLDFETKSRQGKKERTLQGLISLLAPLDADTVHLVEAVARTIVGKRGS
ncbi:MAG: helix-turn-helix transcriptional regulator, partial [Pseudomonadota bacterium]